VILDEYDDENKIQKLVRLIALCPSCHNVKHIGRLAAVEGQKAMQAALWHMQKVNGWSPKKAREHLKESEMVHRERSQFNWTVDLSWLERRGIDAKGESS